MAVCFVAFDFPFEGQTQFCGREQNKSIITESYKMEKQIIDAIMTSLINLYKEKTVMEKNLIVG